MLENSHPARIRFSIVLETLRYCRTAEKLNSDLSYRSEHSRFGKERYAILASRFLMNFLRENIGLLRMLERLPGMLALVRPTAGIATV